MVLIAHGTMARIIGTVGSCLIAVVLAACSRPETKALGHWDQKAAAAYLDQRETWWMGWQGAARDHDTFCVSCHTVLPYALARPTLRESLGEAGLSVDEQRLLDNVTKRVRLWKDVGPYYSNQGYDHKTPESRGTEAVVNALILASHDAEGGRLTDDTRAAFDNMWGLQQTTGDGRGSWLWLQFDLQPWEANDSSYFGAALAALATGTATENYHSAPEIQDHVKLLREYLNRESAAQSPINRVFLLWASTKLPGLLTPEQQKAIIQEILRQQQADGGWRLASLTWRQKSWRLSSLIQRWIREDGTPLDGKSDGVATGLITFVLQQTEIPRDSPQLQRGLSWLLSNQSLTDGSWPATSVNRRRKPSSDVGRFMSDAATGYAVLALIESERTTKTLTSASNH